MCLPDPTLNKSASQHSSIWEQSDGCRDAQPASNTLTAGGLMADGADRTEVFCRSTPNVVSGSGKYPAYRNKHGS